MVALARIISNSDSGSFLPPRVVAELELDSVIPPPDTNKEEQKNENEVLREILKNSRVLLKQLKTGNK